MSMQPVTFPHDPWAESVREEYRAMTDTCPKCEEYAHPVNPDCDRCHGSGHHIGGDALRPCPSCSLWGRRSPYVARAMAGLLPVKVLA